MPLQVIALTITASVVALRIPQCESDPRPARARSSGWFELRPVAAERYFDQHEYDEEIYEYEDHNSYFYDHYREVSDPSSWATPCEHGLVVFSVRAPPLWTWQKLVTDIKPNQVPKVMPDLVDIYYICIF